MKPFFESELLGHIVHFKIYFESKFEPNPTILTLFPNSFCSYLPEVPLCLPGLHHPGARFMQTWRQGGARLVPDLCHPGVRVAQGRCQPGARVAQGRCQPGTSLAPGKIFGGRPQLEDFRTEVYTLDVLRSCMQTS